jgi:short subunit dehydrogenase-like uncharacterized protein
MKDHIALAALGGVSGGTIESLINAMNEPVSVLKEMGHPYYLDPNKNGEPVSSLSDKGGPLLPRWSKPAQRWVGPFVMAAVNEKVVRRSNALMGYAYGAPRRR